MEQCIAIQTVDSGERVADDLWDEGCAVFGDLLSRSLIMVDTKAVRQPWVALSETWCYMHDILRDMGLRLAQENKNDMAEQ